MELTWLTILESIALGLAGVCVFIFAVKNDYFHDLEDAKYQVFWSDLEEDQQHNGNGSPQAPGDRGRR